MTLKACPSNIVEAAIARWRRIAALSVLALVSVACSPLRPDVPKEASTALPPVVDSSSGSYVHSEVDKHKEGVSGFRLLTLSTNALMSRLTLIDHATRSVDVQYYIFANDATGRLVAQRLLAAADRGVRVRLLIDHAGVDDKEHLLDGLDAHEKIEVRFFNPFHTNSPSMPSKIAQFILDGQRLNRRMHNKSLVVDNDVAIIGGRNIGDAYFDASENTNFRDLDVVAIGPVVEAASRSFDNYWNSDAAYPVTAFKDSQATTANLDRVRKSLAEHARAFAESDYAQAAFEALPNGPTADRRGEWFWGNADLLADEPEKVDMKEDQPTFRIGPKIKTIVDGAQHQVLLLSPYLVPGQSGTEYLTSLAQRKVDVQVLTNSLASNDEPAAHAGYVRYRSDLVAGGVKVFELRPAASSKQDATAFGTSSGVALHAKAIVVDKRYAFVGSLNIDQRSKLLNTEMGVMVDCPKLAEAVAGFFAKATEPTSAFEVMLAPAAGQGAKSTHLVWLAQEHGQQVTLDSEPDASSGRKLEVTLLQLLPIESLL
ncbi:MAG TPA: phospholipase D family protein [Rudaea sp.]|jgi:putative cardiolipin synthase|nr:phospholipase D family protein [Rudaea sp.]